MADIQNIGPLPKSTILGFAKGWKIVHYEAHYQKE